MSEQPTPILPYATAGTVNRFYRSANTRGLVTVIMLLVTLGVAVLLIVAFYMQVRLLQDAKAGMGIGRARATANDQRIVSLGGAESILLLATAVCFFLWLYRVTANLPALGVWDAAYGPGRAIGNFFIPFANLILGYRSIREVWTCSAGDRRASAPIVGFWWLAWLGSGVLGQIASGMSSMARTPGQRPDLDALIAMSWMHMAANIAIVVAGVLLVAIIRKINRMQAEKLVGATAPATQAVGPYMVPPLPESIAAAPLPPRPTLGKS